MTQHALLTDTSFSSLHKLLHTELPGTDEYHAAWPGELAGCDSAGRLVWVERLHNVDIHALAKLSDDELSLHRAQSMEFLSFAKREAAESVGAATREYHKHIFVIDLHGFNVGLLLSGDARRVISVVNSVCCSRLLSLFFSSASYVLRYTGVLPALYGDTGAVLRPQCASGSALRMASAEAYGAR